MLEQVLSYLRNWFIAPNGIHHGTYAIENGGITLPFLQNGQYFRIMGSVFNDGLHQYGQEIEGLQDETFSGTIWALAVPKAVLELTAEIAEWQKKYGTVVDSPYTSESFAGYSYTKAGGTNGNGGSGGWKAAFSTRLNQYRKLREI